MFDQPKQFQIVVDETADCPAGHFSRSVRSGAPPAFCLAPLGQSTRPEQNKWLRISGAIKNHVVQSTLSILSIGQMVLYVKLLGEIISVLSPQQNRILHK